MIKRKTLLFIAILLVAVAQFVTQKAAAFSDYCEEPQMKVTDPGTGWTVDLVSVTERDDGKWDWYYKVTNRPLSDSASGLNFIAMLIPDCCTSPKIEIYFTDASSGFTNYFNVGAGEPTLYFGRYIQQARVAKGTADNQVKWHLITNTQKMTTSTILLKVRKIGALAFEMAVPACDPETDPITQSSEDFSYINAEGNTYTVTVYKDQAGNITEITRTVFDDDGNPIDFDIITDQGIPANEIMARFPNPDPNLAPDMPYVEEPFNFVPNDTVTKSGDNSTCGYWYRGKFYNFCY